MKFAPIHALFALSAMFGLLSQGCGPNDPNWAPFPPAIDAIGKASDTPPAGAKMISSIEFANLWHAHVLWTFKDRELEPRPPGIAGTSATLGGAAEEHPRVAFRGFDGADHEVELLAESERQLLAAQAVRNFPTFENQLRIYGHLHGGIVSDEVKKLSIGSLMQLNKSTAAAKASSQPMLEVSVGELGDAAGQQGSKLPNALKGPSCSGDLGYGAGTDASGAGSTCDRHSALGVFGAFNFPLRPHLTCVKDQANRGTCGAFALAASLETEVSINYGVKVNLSEQDLYAHFKGYWWPTRYGDGVKTDEVALKMISEDYVVPFEKSWNYNPSNSRIEDDKTSLYTDSCKDYDEDCSDTAHQGSLVCTTMNDLLYCGYTTPVNLDGTGYRVTSQSELWNGSDAAASLNTLISVLGQGKPVAIGMNVPPSFDGASTDGYVTYNPNDGASRGAHLIEAIGSISNTTLSKLQPAAPLGSGGGYIIAKNSWGLCFGDGGIVYLPYDWVKTQVWSATTLDSIESAK